MERNDNDTLIRWKAIAAALDISASTARRWTFKLGMPAYKLGGQIRASRAELARWESETGKKPGRALAAEKEED